MSREHELDQAFIQWLKCASERALRSALGQYHSQWRVVAVERELKRRCLPVEESNRDGVLKDESGQE